MNLPRTTLSLEGLKDIAVVADTSDARTDLKSISILIDMDIIKSKIQQKATEIGYSMNLTTKMVTLKVLFRGQPIRAKQGMPELLPDQNSSDNDERKGQPAGPSSNPHRRTKKKAKRAQA